MSVVLESSSGAETLGWPDAVPEHDPEAAAEQAASAGVLWRVSDLWSLGWLV